MLIINNRIFEDEEDEEDLDDEIPEMDDVSKNRYHT